MLQRALYDVVAVGVERELHHARAERAGDHRRLGVGPAELMGTNGKGVGGMRLCGMGLCGMGLCGMGLCGMGLCGMGLGGETRTEW